MNRESLKRHCEAMCHKFKDVPTSVTYGEHRLVLDLLEQTRWIPVSERLPEAEYGESDSVLVCFENGTQDALYFNGGIWCYPTGEIYISVNYKNGWHNKVVAWMPLPEPYKAESEDNG